MKKHNAETVDLKIIFFTLLLLLSAIPHFALAAPAENYKVVKGIAIYIGFLLTTMIQDYPINMLKKMHGGIPSDSNQYHLIIALFDDSTSNRITNAQITATVKEV